MESVSVREKEELGQDFYFQTFSHQFVYVSPQELHHEDEQTDEKSSCEEQQETFRVTNMSSFFMRSMLVYYYQSAKIA